MAQNDYFVIVYQLLKYLYECLKKGEKPEACYVKGIAVNHTKDGVLLGDLPDAIITPKGISYLFENSLLEKAKKTLNDVKEMVPFV